MAAERHDTYGGGKLKRYGRLATAIVSAYRIRGI